MKRPINCSKSIWLSSPVCGAKIKNKKGFFQNTSIKRSREKFRQIHLDRWTESFKVDFVFGPLAAKPLRILNCLIRYESWQMLSAITCQIYSQFQLNGAENGGFPIEGKVTTSLTTSFVMLLQHRRNGNNINQKMMLYLDVVGVQHHSKFPPPKYFR